MIASWYCFPTPPPFLLLNFQRTLSLTFVISPWQISWDTRPACGKFGTSTRSARNRIRTSWRRFTSRNPQKFPPRSQPRARRRRRHRQPRRELARCECNHRVNRFTYHTKQQPLSTCEMLQTLSRLIKEKFKLKLFAGESSSGSLKLSFPLSLLFAVPSKNTWNAARAQWR